MVDVNEVKQRIQYRIGQKVAPAKIKKEVEHWANEIAKGNMPEGTDLWQLLADVAISFAPKAPAAPKTFWQYAVSCVGDDKGQFGIPHVYCEDKQGIKRLVSTDAHQLIYCDIPEHEQDNYEAGSYYHAATGIKVDDYNRQFPNYERVIPETTFRVTVEKVDYIGKIGKLNIPIVEVTFRDDRIDRLYVSQFNKKIWDRHNSFVLSFHISSKDNENIDVVVVTHRYGKSVFMPIRKE